MEKELVFHLADNINSEIKQLLEEGGDRIQLRMKAEANPDNV
jgi:hypothetical protein